MQLHFCFPSRVYESMLVNIFSSGASSSLKLNQLPRSSLGCQHIGNIYVYTSAEPVKISEDKVSKEPKAVERISQHCSFTHKQNISSCR